MKKILCAIAILSCFIGKPMFAQQPQLSQAIQKKHGNYLKPGSKPGWIEFKNTVPYRAEFVFRDAPDLLGMQANDELRLFKTHIDEAGNKHYKFAQYYNGVRIEGKEYYSHERNGVMHLINGHFVQGLNLNVNPTLSKEQAVTILLQTYPAQQYLWEDERAEAAFKKKEKRDNATLYPTPELLIVKINPKGDDVASNFILAYRMYLFAKIPYIAKYVYINANTGEIIRDKSLDHNCNSTTVETTFNGTRTVYTDFRSEDCRYEGTVNSYFPIDDCHPDSEIRSYYAAGYGTADYGEDFLYCSSTNEWDGFANYTMIMTSLWGVRKAFDYYLNTYGHESFDGSDGLIDIFNNRTYFDAEGDPNCNNANFTDILDNLNFGAGGDCMPGTMDDYNCIDVCGHEFTHGVIEYAHFDALDYQDESGALNESFADIFGEMVEIYVEGDADLTWLHSEDRGYNRSFINPNDKGDPDTYLGDYWAPIGGDDYGGVHTNSGVQNHMFYLLSEGGDGVNDHGIEFHVDGIGYDKARRIAWGAMMDYLDGSDGYIIARNAWIQAAIDLYGSCSQEVISVGQAFQAVGVTEYTAFDVASVCGTYVLTGYADATYGIENKSLLFGDFLSACTTTISTTAVVNFKSGYYINFSPGFEAKSGSVFTAWIDECEISEYDPDDLRFDADYIYSENLSEKSITQFAIYPVPSATFVNLDLDLANQTNANLYVTDLSGQLITIWIADKTLDSGLQQFEFDVSNLASGMYLAVLKTEDAIQTTKFVVQH